MEQKQIEWFATLGVGGIVAAFMFMYYRRDVKYYTELWKEQAESNREVIKQMLGVIRDNTEALTKLVSVVDSLHRRLDVVKETGFRLGKGRDHHE